MYASPPALKAEKSAQKDKDAILRNHAHYKATVVASAARKMPRRKLSRLPLQDIVEATQSPTCSCFSVANTECRFFCSDPTTTKGFPAGNANIPAKPAAPTPQPRRSSQVRQQAPKLPPAPLSQTSGSPTYSLCRDHVTLIHPWAVAKDIQSRLDLDDTLQQRQTVRRDDWWVWGRF